MRAVLAAVAVAAALAPAMAQIDPVACTTNAALEFTFDLDLAAACYKGTVDHQNSSALSNTVTSNILFPTPTPSGNVPTSADGVVYGVYVFDPTQGSDTSFEWNFDTIPRYQAFGTSSGTSLDAVSLQQRASTGFVSTRGDYLYATHLTNPVGRYVISFETDAARTTKLRYVIAVKRLSAAEGHLALDDDHPIKYKFKTAGTAKHVSLGTWSGTSRNVYTEASDYSPGGDNRLVQDLKVHSGIDTGAAITSAAAFGESTSTVAADHTAITSGVAIAEVGLPPAIFPRRVSGHGASTIPGVLKFRWGVRLYDTTGTARGVDLTAAPGPFLLLNPGSTDDDFTEAERVRPGETVTVAFDSDPKTNADSRAKLSHKLIRVELPSKWWSSRFELKATPTDGRQSGAVVEMGQYFSEVHYSPVERRKLSGSSSVISNSFLDDPALPGIVTMPNTAMSSVSGNNPVIGIGSPTSIGSYPLYDSRRQRNNAYILVCRSASCATTSSTSSPTKITGTVKFHSVAAFGGECDSAADCVAGDSGHPAQNRAALSSNGDSARFDQCMLFVDGTGYQPETRCVECRSDCECNPGQFCYDYTGLQRFGPHQRVIHEESRLRAGVCVRRDLNNTQIGRRCRRSTALGQPSVYNPSSDQDVTFNPSSLPFVENQPGPVPCGEYVFSNGSYQSGGVVYTNTSGMAIATLWTGTCDVDGICRECGASAVTAYAFACAGKHVCLDGTWWRSFSMDYSLRTLTNNTVAGGVLTVAIVAFFILFIAGWTCICASCCSGERKGCCGGKGDKKAERKPVETETVAVKP